MHYPKRNPVQLYSKILFKSNIHFRHLSYHKLNMTQLQSGIKHRVLALVSGGKDSCFSMLQCVSAGHEIVGLANLKPKDENEKELDSYMYQTVGHQAIDMYADAMRLPLFRGTIS